MLRWEYIKLLLVLLWVIASPQLMASPTVLNAHGVFHQILVQGDMTITLHQTQGPSYAIAKGDIEDLQHLDFVIADDWLKVRLGKEFPKFSAIHVDIWVNNLCTLIQRGKAKVTGHQVRSNSLAVSSSGSVPLNLDGHIRLTGLQVRGSSHIEMSGIQTKNLSLDMREHAYVKLAGTIGVSQVHLSGHSWLSMYWVNTNHLDMTYGDYAFVQMAGQALVLDLEMYGNAKFAGRYLRANRVFVKTHDHAIAQIAGVRSQHTLALDASKIDYYNVPLMKTDFMVDNAAVLDMREWTMPYAQDNQHFAEEAAIQSAVGPDPTKWVGTFSIGPTWAAAGEQQTFNLTPAIEKTYTANRNMNTLTAGEVFVGVQKNLPANIYGHFGLTGGMDSQVGLSGNIWDDADPAFDNYTYSYNIQHAYVGLKGKFFKDFDCYVLPWFSAGVGVGFNSSHAFSNQPLINEALPNNNFGDHTQATVTYTIGFGAQRILAEHWQVGLGYEFSDWGQSLLGKADGQTINSGLTLSHLYTNGIMFNLTYVS